MKNGIEFGVLLKEGCNHKIQPADKKKYEKTCTIDDSAMVSNCINIALKYGLYNGINNSDKLYTCISDFLYGYEYLAVESQKVVDDAASNSPLGLFINIFMNNLATRISLLYCIDAKELLDNTGYAGNNSILQKANGEKIAVYSTRWLNNLLLLKDNERIEDVDYTVLIRVKPSIENELLFFSNELLFILKQLVSKNLLSFEDFKRELSLILAEKESEVLSKKKALNEMHLCVRERFIINEEIEHIERLREYLSFSLIATFNEFLYKSEVNVGYPLVARVLSDFIGLCYPWSYELTGYITREDVIALARDDSHLISSAESLQCRHFSENLRYVRAKDMRPIMVKNLQQ